VQAHSFSGTPQIDVLVQLLVTAAGDAKYLQNHSKYLVQLFLHFLALQYDPLFTEDQETLEPEDLEQLGYGGRASHKVSYQELKAAGKKSRYETCEDAAVAGAVVGAEASADGTYASGGAVAKMGRTDATRVLTGFLDVFANMTSGAPLYQAEVLRRVFTALLAKTHNQVQLLALRSLYLWKPEDVMPYKTHLENLIDDEKYRDELTFFTIDDDLGQVKEAHRPGLVPVLSRILYAKVVQRKVLGAKTSLAQRRATVLAFFAGMREEEFGVLVSIVFRPFRLVSDKAEDAQHNSALLTALSSKKLLGFLNTLKDLVDQVGHRLTEHLPQMTSTLLALVAHVFASGSTCEAEEGDGAVDDAAEDDQSADYKQKLLKKLRGLCLRRVTDIITKFKSSDFSAFVPRLLATLKQRIVRLPLENTQSPVGLLESFHEMAHNDSLAAHLFSDVEVLPAIFGCMAASRAAYPVRKASLEIADVLVRQAQTLGLQDKMSAHMSVLLDNVYLHLKALVDNGGPSQAGDMQAQVREISLLRLQFNLLAELSRYRCTPQQAAQLLDLLIPFLSNRKKLGNVSASEESRKFILQTCANLVKLAPDSSVYVAPAARQLLPKMSEATRSAACDFILAIGRPLAKVSCYISDLNAMSSERLDEYDFDKRLAAYAACCQPEFLSSLNADHVRVLAAQCMHDFREDDISVRNHGIKLLLLILGRIKEAATCKGGAATFQAGGGHVSSQLAGTAQGQGADMWEVYLDVIYPALKKNLTDRKRVLRNEAFKMLINASREFTEFHADLAVLSHVDPEQDISLNMLHMQMHRRIKAMKSLQTAVQGGGVSAATLRYILLPLVWWNIIEPESQDLSGNKVTKKDEGAYNLADEAVRAAGAIALQLPWKDYHVMLWDALRELSLSRPYEKVVIKLVCAIVTNFHFALDPTAEAQVSEFSHLLGLAGASGGAAAASKTAKEDAAADSKRRQSEVAKRLDAGDDEDDDVDREEQEMVSSGVLKEPAGKAMEVGGKVQAMDKAVLSAGKTGDPGEVYLHVVYKLMPELEKHMTEKANATSVDKRVQQGKLRPAMAVAVVKILNLLPEERMRARLPHVIGVVCNGLRVREQSDRDAARGTLADIMRCLGPLFLNFVLGEVKSNLSLGFQRHVCGFTFFSLLDSLQDLLAGPHLLPSIPLILEVYFLELYGTVGEEKEVDKIVSKTREAKSTKAYDCIELIGRVLSFELFSPAVLEPEDHEWGLRAQIHAAATLKQRKRMEEMLRRLGLGLAANPSVTSKEMMLWVHKLVSHYLPACVPSNKKSKLELKEDKRKQAQKHFGVGGGAVGEAGQKRSKLLEKRPEPAEKLPPMGPEWERRSRAREGATMMEVSTLGDGESVSVNRNEYLLAELALTLLHTCLKREKVDLKVKAHMEMLNPFVAVTQKLMLSKHDTVVVLALKIFSLLLPLHLPATDEELPWALKNIFFLLQRGGSTSSLTMSGCFKALTVMLREAKGSVKLSQSQLKVLLSFAQQDILELGRQAVAFGLVRAIVARKLICEEVYDLMDKIAEHMVTSQSEQTRALSAQTLIVFMLDFPMGDKRLHAHMTRLVRDLDYGYESGRKVVLEVRMRSTCAVCARVSLCVLCVRVCVLGCSRMTDPAGFCACSWVSAGDGAARDKATATAYGSVPGALLPATGDASDQRRLGHVPKNGRPTHQAAARTRCPQAAGFPLRPHH
jgi:U3 small nucleolar RNA-associated protein 20